MRAAKSNVCRTDPRPCTTPGTISPRAPTYAGSSYARGERISKIHSMKPPSGSSPCNWETRADRPRPDPRRDERAACNATTNATRKEQTSVGKRFSQPSHRPAPPPPTGSEPVYTDSTDPPGHTASARLELSFEMPSQLSTIVSHFRLAAQACIRARPHPEHRLRFVPLRIGLQKNCRISFHPPCLRQV